MSTEPETTEKTCDECGKTFDTDTEGGWIDGIGECCDHCYHDAGTECALCRERYGDQEEHWSGLHRQQLLGWPYTSTRYAPSSPPTRWNS